MISTRAPRPSGVVDRWRTAERSSIAQHPRAVSPRIAAPRGPAQRALARILRLLLLVAISPFALAESSLELQQRALACGSDIGCIQDVVEAMQAQFGTAAQPQSAPAHGDGPCRACRARVAQLKQYGSVAGYACRPLDVDLTWDFHQQEERTPASRIGPPTSVQMTVTEGYAACALIISQAGGSGARARRGRRQHRSRVVRVRS